MPPSSSLRSRASTNSLVPATPQTLHPTPRKQNFGNDTPTKGMPLTNTTNGDAMDLGTASTMLDGTATADDDTTDSGDADKMDVHALSSDTPSSILDDVVPHAISEVGKTSPANTTSWMGPPANLSNGNATPPATLPTLNHGSTQDESATPTADDMRNYDFDGDISDGDSPNASDIELDDDYGDLDRMSEASDISQGSDESDAIGADRLREREYEQELQELEDHGGIDWADEWSFQYNPEFGCSDYAICGEDGLLKSTHDLDSRQPSIAEGVATDFQLPDLNTMLPLRAFTPAHSDSEDSSKSTPTTPLTPDAPKFEDPITPRTSSLSSSNDAILDGDETEDDEDYLVAPAAPLERLAPSIETSDKQQAKDKNFKPSYRILDETTLPKPNTSAKNKIRLRKFNKFQVDESRPYCFTIETPDGGYRFKWTFPKGSGREGKKPRGTFGTSLRRSESVSAFLADSPFESSDSGRDSPTYIDWNDAMLQGNTNTGAAITDTIRGRIFAQTHCRPRTASHTMHPVPSFFERILNLSSQNAAAWTPTLDMMDQSMEDAVDFDELIDVDECAEPSSQDFFGPFAELASLVRPVGRYANNNHSPTAAGKEQAVDAQIASHQTPSSTIYDSLTSPSQPLMSTPTPIPAVLAPPFSPISPRKRRLSDRSTDGSRPVSQKKSRVSWSSDIPLDQSNAIKDSFDGLREMSLDPINPTLMDLN